jgi:glycosyltransferase involved in cell wall biosynthesis
LQLLKAGTIRVGYFYEVPDSGSFRYRAYNMAQALNSHSKTHSASFFFLSDIPLVENFTDYLDVLVLVRFRFSGAVSRLIGQFRAKEKKVLFDIDDLIFDPSHTPLVAASLNFGLEPGLVLDNWYSLTSRLGQTLTASDAAIVSTPTLAEQVSLLHEKTVGVIPNFLNSEQLETSEKIRDETPVSTGSGLTIGYFSGSKSHALDFAVAETAIIEFLLSNKDARFVVGGFLEVPAELEKLDAQFTRLPFMDYVSLQRAIASVDVNVVPLQHNSFTDSKSELKFFEAAAVSTVTIASPTEVFSRVINHQVTGLLSEADQWLVTFEGVQALSLPERARIAGRAREFSLSHYTGEAQLHSIEKALNLA